MRMVIELSRPGARGRRFLVFARTVTIHSMGVEPVVVTARSVHMDAGQQAGSRPATRSRGARDVLPAAACLIALVVLLAVRASDGAHPIYTRHAVVMTTAADQTGQVRAAQPLAITAPVMVSTPVITRVPEVAAEASSDRLLVSSARTRGPPGTA